MEVISGIMSGVDIAPSAPPTITLVLARGGSKGIPGKNLAEFCGQPLLSWTLSQALRADIGPVYVSTDSSEIALCATEMGVPVLRRPEFLASDDASADEAVKQALTEMNFPPDGIVVVPQVTSPLRFPSHLRNAKERLCDEGFDAVFSGVRIDDIGVWQLLERPCPLTYNFEERLPRQSRPPLIVENGSIYVSRAWLYLQRTNRLGGRIGTIEMPKWALPEIDDPVDLKICEVLMQEFVLGSESTVESP